MGSFKITGNEQIDGTEDTDGIEVTHHNLGSQFPNGLLVVQDGSNQKGDKILPQNFKLVEWGKIKTLIDNQFSVGGQ